MRIIKNFFRNTFSFSGYLGKGEFWSGVARRLIGFFCAVIFMAIAVCVIVPGDVEELAALSESLVIIMAVVWLYQIIAMTRRRLRDAGHGAKTYLLLLIPIYGLIVFLLRLCDPGIPPSKEEILKLLK